MTNKSFISYISPIIVKEARARGYKFPSAIIAQACLESNYGRSALSSKYYNYFGMKCGSSWKGKVAELMTREELRDGTSIKLRDKFRAYDSPEEGIKGYFDFISMKRYSNLKECKSPLEYITLLKSDGWATASQYVKNVYAVLMANGLSKYDGEENFSVQTPIERIAYEVIAGKYGNGPERISKLRALGYDPTAVQRIVNKIVKETK